jgi:hypothetical protein
MKVRFIKNQEPCVVYEVKNPNPTMEYDDQYKKYMECIEIEVMGFVPMELLTEASDHPNNVNAIDLAVYLNNHSSRFNQNAINQQP